MRSVSTALAALLGLAAAALAQNARGGEAGTGPGTVVVVNELDRDVMIWINGELEGSVEAGNTREFGRVAAGRLSVQAGGTHVGGPVAREDRALAPGETFTWTLHPVVTWTEEKGTGTLVLMNRLDREVEVLLGDNPAGRLAPAAQRGYPRVVAGTVVASARDAEGEVLEKRELTIEPGRITQWEIGGKPPAPSRPAATVGAPIEASKP